MAWRATSHKSAHGTSAASEHSTSHGETSHVSHIASHSSGIISTATFTLIFLFFPKTFFFSSLIVFFYKFGSSFFVQIRENDFRKNFLFTRIRQ